MTHAIHSTLSLMAGDDWVIMGTLLATDGAPVDLTNASIIWGMVGMDGHLVVLDDVSIERMIPMTAGGVRIIVPRAKTAALSGGYYYDTLRLLINDNVNAMWAGLIEVQSDPYGT